MAQPDPALFAELIGNWGFPVAAFMLMYRMAQKSIEKNTEALQNLQKTVERIEN
jgi:hypothetical protein